MKRLVILLSAVLMMSCPGKEPIPTPTTNSVSLARPNIAFSDVSGQWISITSDEGWDISLEFEAGDEEWASLVGATSGSKTGMVKLNNGKNNGAAARSVDVVAEFENGDIKRATLTQGFDDTPPPYIPKWIELPAMNLEGGQMFVKHQTNINGTSVRNYSMLYDPATYMSYWVAYPLQRDYMGNADRDDVDFAPDPSVTFNLQPNLEVSYSYGGRPYERGHQLPAADRTKNLDMLAQTFYWTNMTPQHNQLNNGRWKALEIHLRDIVGAHGADTMWIVTGAILRTVGGSEEIETIVNRTNSSQIMPVPNYYYKVAVMKYNGVYKGVGFWIDHRNTAQYSGTNLVVNAKTIDQIEALTGFDFFVNLSDADEVAAESNVDTSFWRI